MKKFILTLTALFFLSLTSFGQANIVFEAPQLDGSLSIDVGPTGESTSAFHRACYLIPKSELDRLALTNSVITTVAFQLFRSCSPAASGQYTVYMENTADLTYLKGTNWTNAISTMGAPRYAGPMTMPLGNQNFTASTSNMVLTTPFTYTGNGIYIALDWSSASTSSDPAIYFCNSGGNGASMSSSSSAPTTMTLNTLQPVFKFTAGNTATNELSVNRLDMPGTVTRFSGNGNLITAAVRNNGINTMSSVQVSLTVTGPATYNDVQTINAIAAGGTGNVTFTFNPTTNGTYTVFANVAADQYTVNNSTGRLQSVTCNSFGIAPLIAATRYTNSGYGTATGTTGLSFAFRHVASTNPSSVVAVSCVVPGFASAGNAGKQLYAFLCDSNGDTLATGKKTTVYGLDAMSTYSFYTPQELIPGNTYYIGLGLTTGGYFPIGQEDADLDAPFTGFYTIPNAFIFGGGTPNAVNIGYLSLQGIFSYSNTLVSAVASQTAVCNNKVGVDPATQVTLTATGAGSPYTWSPGIPTASNTPVIVVTPSINAAQGTFTYGVIGSDAASGCKSNRAIITVSVNNNLCTGIVDNGDFGTTISVYPNPAVDGKVTVKGLEGANQITVLNVIGQAVINKKTSEEETVVDLGNLPAGNYFVKITNSKGQFAVTKVIKD